MEVIVIYWYNSDCLFGIAEPLQDISPNEIARAWAKEHYPKLNPSEFFGKVMTINRVKIP